MVFHLPAAEELVLSLLYHAFYCPSAFPLAQIFSNGAIRVARIRDGVEAPLEIP